ncbi:hypothetical protein EU538_07800 [Candidatus Thorarchaeota archaeon]|nr:MAG: hypothetical protein EU538_07800 [Candidatus Thorarchaeota archaeon]
MIVLLTDFGESEYVGMMKGMIYSICDKARVLDLTHSVSRHSIIEGAWILLKSYSYFPRHSTFVVVVDPGVGTEREAVLVKTENFDFIGPDNGILYPAVHDDGVERIFTIAVEEDDSKTFHGRDVFARMAAYLEKGVAGRRLGTYKESLGVPLRFHLDGREGQVVHIDRFGNIITNLLPTSSDIYHLVCEELDRDLEFHDTYGTGPSDDLFLVTGSAGTLEICLKDGNAAQRINLRPGDQISLLNC